MRRILFLLPLLFLLGCGNEPTSQDYHRFTEEVYPQQGNESCLVRVMTDHYSGCQYLLVCNDVTLMPHTCQQDQPQ